MKIIDVTLRDGGHAVDFNWPLEFAQNYYALMSSTKEVNYIELGYWGQTAKSRNMFYNLDMNKVRKITGGASKKNVSIMIDFHYCNKDLNTYPTIEQEEVAIIRLCSRKEDIKEALAFGENLKRKTNLNVSFNIFNVTNYHADELLSICKQVAASSLDFVYFADTHGNLDLRHDNVLFEDSITLLKSSNKQIGLHLHNHSGKAMLNFSMLPQLGFDLSDTSVRGVGKGSGNLPAEHVLQDSLNFFSIVDFIDKYNDLLTTSPSPYELITSKLGLTDNYAKQGKLMKMKIPKFYSLCKEINGLDKDNFNSYILDNG